MYFRMTTLNIKNKYKLYIRGDRLRGRHGYRALNCFNDLQVCLVVCSINIFSCPPNCNPHLSEILDSPPICIIPIIYKIFIYQLHLILTSNCQFSYSPTKTFMVYDQWKVNTFVFDVETDKVFIYFYCNDTCNSINDVPSNVTTSWRSQYLIQKQPCGNACIVP